MENYTRTDKENITANANEHEYALQISSQIIAMLAQISVMLGMGAITSIQDIIKQCKQPVPVIIAMASQFFALPASTFGLIHLLNLPPLESIGAMILASCPGGTLSNICVYYCGGDIILSIILTTMSTVLAFGFMPLNLWLYTREWTNASKIKIPYKGITITIAGILVPLAVAMIVKKRAPKLAHYLKKVGSFGGLILVWLFAIVHYFLNPDAFNQKWNIWLISLSAPIGGFIFGLIFSSVCQISCKQKITIAIETGMQSVGLAITIISTSFPKELHPDLTPLIIICGFYATVLTGLIWILSGIINYFRKNPNKCFNKFTLINQTPDDVDIDDV